MTLSAAVQGYPRCWRLDGNSVSRRRNFAWQDRCKSIPTLVFIFWLFHVCFSLLFYYFM